MPPVDDRDDLRNYTRLDRRPHLMGFNPTADRDREVAQAVEEIRSTAPPWLRSRDDE